MNGYDQFHDGSFDGLWVDQSTIHFFLSTENKERFTVVATGVVRLLVEEFREGNVVLDVVTRDHDEITRVDISELYGIDGDSSKEEVANRLLAEARQQGLIVLQIDASYGGTCLALAGSIELLSRSEWLRRCCTAAS